MQSSPHKDFLPPSNDNDEQTANSSYFPFGNQAREQITQLV